MDTSLAASMFLIFSADETYHFIQQTKEYAVIKYTVQILPRRSIEIPTIRQYPRMQVPDWHHIETRRGTPRKAIDMPGVGGMRHADGYDKNSSIG